MATRKLFLKSIKYTGKNIGKDLTFVIRVFGTEHKTSLELKNRSIKEFDPLEFISNFEFNKEEKLLKTPMKILVIEDDPIKDDIGWKEKNHRINVSPTEPTAFSHIVEIRERGGSRTRKNIAKFEFNFVIDSPKIINPPNGKIRLPDLNPPLMRTKSLYHPVTCDLSCLQKCGSNDWNCILKCCTVNN